MVGGMDTVRAHPRCQPVLQPLGERALWGQLCRQRGDSAPGLAGEPRHRGLGSGGQHQFPHLVRLLCIRRRRLLLRSALDNVAPRPPSLVGCSLVSPRTWSPKESPTCTRCSSHSSPSSSSCSTRSSCGSVTRPACWESSSVCWSSRNISSPVRCWPRRSFSPSSHSSWLPCSTWIGSAHTCGAPCFRWDSPWGSRCLCFAYPILYSLQGPEHYALTIPSGQYQADLWGAVLPTSNQVIAPTGLHRHLGPVLGQPLREQFVPGHPVDTDPGGVGPGVTPVQGRRHQRSADRQRICVVARISAPRRQPQHGLAHARRTLASPAPAQRRRAREVLDLCLPFCGIGPRGGRRAPAPVAPMAQPLGGGGGGGGHGRGGSAPVLPALPYAEGSVDTPSFFTSSAVDSVPAGSVAVVYPPTSPVDADSTLWQASSAMRFKMPGAYRLLRIPEPPLAGGR